MLRSGENLTDPLLPSGEEIYGEFEGGLDIFDDESIFCDTSRYQSKGQINQDDMFTTSTESSVLGSSQANSHMFTTSTESSGMGSYSTSDHSVSGPNPGDAHSFNHRGAPKASHPYRGQGCQGNSKRAVNQDDGWNVQCAGKGSLVTIDQSRPHTSPEQASGYLSDATTEKSLTLHDGHGSLDKIEPTIGPLLNSVPNFDPNLYIDANIEFLDMDGRVFEKQQSRKGKVARQTIKEGKIRVLVTSEREVQGMKVWVRRQPKAAEQCGDTNGETELETPQCIRHAERNQWLFVVDLDSVYNGRERPVYKLAQVETNERNLFELLAHVIFTDHGVSEKVVSKPFLVRTKKDKKLSTTEEEEAPLLTGSKRPHTWHHGRLFSKKKNRLSDRLSYNSPESPLSYSSSSSYDSGSGCRVEKVVVDHLEAQRAHIKQLTFDYMLQTRRGDIAYHLRLTDQARDKNLTEGVVVGFFPTQDGGTEIEPLTGENVKEAVMAGVISRSAYLEAQAPAIKDKGKTDSVCVIGMVSVQVTGSVQPGERVFTSNEHPGTAIPESHLPVGAFITNRNTLLGMAMEASVPNKPGGCNLVKCFVCIVLGIGNQQLAKEVENIMNGTERSLKEVIKVSKRTWKKTKLLLMIAAVVLGLLCYMLYELRAPGTAYRYWRCQQGGIKGSTLSYKFRYQEGREVRVNGLEFSYSNLLKKLSGTADGSYDFPRFKPSNDTGFLDRCAFGGERDAGFWGPTVRGAIALVIRRPCEGPVYKFQWSGRKNKWCYYYNTLPKFVNITCSRGDHPHVTHLPLSYQPCRP
ncbi:uncharacterized protein LOC116619128 isoform X2 [Nematostella vectensis]|uniref:uncharacterized protein LOC116619128 isoform X2 n=1 Tax=Nematostella vectensis TaxID=45351 RepID=UPI0020774BE3|nr:uncharacterized protein LOC116619128 isoform X2 [Nematostella vectensis]